MNSDQHRETLKIVVQFLQLATLVIGVAGLFLSVGRRDQTLDQNTAEILQLRDIASDLVKTSIETTTTNREQDRRLEELRDRLDALERRP
tara:strand:- start:3244 stop:3513 length:270 start_codon:yes stop_codon:yes gene_type:complete